MPDSTYHSEAEVLEYYSDRSSRMETFESHIRAPAAACIGWIPYFETLSSMGDCEYARHPFAKPRPYLPAAFSVLFASGNSPVENADPNAHSLGGDRDLERLIQSKNFRIVLSLDDVALSFNKSEERLRLSVRLRSAMGFTPYRRGPMTYHAKGCGVTEPLPAKWSSDRVEFECWSRFKIGRAGDWGLWFLAGHRAPSAVARISYTIYFDGRIVIKFGGSFLPSQSYYVDWQRDGWHDMLRNGKGEIDGFLHAGSCADAPGTWLHTFHGQRYRLVDTVTGK